MRKTFMVLGSLIFAVSIGRTSDNLPISDGIQDTAIEIKNASHPGRSMVHGQDFDNKHLDRASGKVRGVIAKPGQTGEVLVLRDGSLKTQFFDLTEQLNLIVEFKEEPLFISQKRLSGTALRKAGIEERFRQFRSSLNSMVQSSSATLRVDLLSPHVVREYHKIFYGAAIRVPRAILSQIQELSYVKVIHQDARMQAYLEESVHLIGADSVWSGYGIRGEGIIVGIIDTGIDYLHPALGGAAIPNGKVIGGYDFVNLDEDPADDNGHGSHVAGIVAADGDSVKGVAPKAKLMALKVLDQKGSGSSANVIAAIEWTVDPNDDGDMSDKLDVVNMSLGARGHPEDAPSIAVNNAVSLGVMFCVAAGNNTDFRTIGSPGTSKLALTVGATNKSDRLAGFSSKGPTARTHSIKPDIGAPGVAILSTYHGGYSRLSGTSMATPHVAGVCALLKSIHPSWSPAQIKSAIVASAVDLGEEIMAQGSGRLDAVKAAGTSSFTVPANVSLGLDNSNEALWIKAETLWVFNDAFNAQNYTITSGILPPGVTLSPSPSSFSVLSNGSQMVILTFQVNNNVVSFPEKGSLTYGGMLKIVGSIDTIKVPWAFVKASRLIITLNEAALIHVIGENHYDISLNADSLSSTYVEMVVPKGIFDIVANFSPRGQSKFVFREHLSVEDVTAISINSSEAQYSLQLNGIDEQGLPISRFDSYQKLYTLVYPESSFVKFGLYSGLSKTVFVSSFSNRFAFVAGEVGFDGMHKAYIVQHHPIENVHESRILTNAVSDYRNQNIKIEYPPKASSGKVTISLVARLLSIQGLSYWQLLPPRSSPLGLLSWEGKLFLPSNRHPDVAYTSIASFSYTFPDTISYVTTPPFGLLRDSIGVFVGENPPPSVFLSPSEGIMRFGGSPVYTDAFFLNNSSRVENFNATPNFYGPLDEKRTDLFARYTLYDDKDNVLESDTLSLREPRYLPPNLYRFEVKYEGYFVNGVRATALLNTKFDLRRGDANPPGFSSLQILNLLRRPVGSLKTNELASLAFSANDIRVVEHESSPVDFAYQPIADSTRAFYRFHGSHEWAPLQLRQVFEDSTSAMRVGKYYVTDLSSTTNTDSSAIDLKFEIQDMSGNVTQWTLEPAYGVGKYGNPTSVEKVLTSAEIPGYAELRQNYPNPFNPRTVLAFDIPRTTKARLSIYNVLGQMVALLVNEEKDPGRYLVSWDGRSQLGIPLSSGTYFYRLELDNFTKVKKLILLK